MLHTLHIFFSALEKENIPYVQWKSNERLGEFLTGESDLDILFVPKDKKKTEKVFKKIGAKKFEALPIGKYPNIEDYLVVDPGTGKLIHLHVHYQLDIGETDVKRYPLPWVEVIINNRIQHPDYPVWISSHEHELLLLMIREALRIHPLKVKYFPSRHKIEKKSLSEFRWLKERVSRERYKEAVCHLLKEYPGAAEQVLSMYDHGLSDESVRKLWAELENLRKRYRTTGDAGTTAILLKKRVKHSVHNILKLLNIRLPQKRINPRGGCIVAITGSDGSGKSTTVEKVAAQCQRKMDVATLYLGLPKPEKSRFPGLVKLIYKLRLKRIWNLCVKQRTLKKALRFRQQGMLVICDRFPQAQFPGVMDGPLAEEWLNSKNPLKKGFARYERKVFESMQSEKTDLVIKLQVDAKTSHIRGKLPLQTAALKTKIAEKTAFPGAGKIHTIHTAENGVDEVIKQTMNEIWEAIK
jgi:hypothetical protein